MKTQVNDGGPAFPESFIYEPSKGEYGQYTSAGEVGFGGMSLRAYFAAAAMQGLLANSFYAEQNARDGGTKGGPKDLALASLRNADALIEELTKEAK